MVDNNLESERFHQFTLGERIVRLESEMRQLRSDVRDAKADIKEVRDVVVQVKGARWLLIGLAAIASTLGAFASKFIPISLVK